jgi:hypothetical protein
MSMREAGLLILKGSSTEIVKTRKYTAPKILKTIVWRKTMARKRYCTASSFLCPQEYISSWLFVLEKSSFLVDSKPYFDRSDSRER